MKYIDISKEKKDALKRAFNVSSVTVWSALTFNTNSDLARQIRNVAILGGGVVKNIITTPDGFYPNCEERFIRRDDGSIKKIIQTFSNEVRVELDYDSDNGYIYTGQTICKTFSKPTLDEWHIIVFEAQSLSDSLNS